MDLLEIVEYQECYHDIYKSLSYEWLERYVIVEPEDECILNNPREAVLNGGGHIFFAKYQSTIIGTVTLIKVDNITFELAKLAVTEPFRGKQIGSRLIEKCIDTANFHGAARIILYTNHVLEAAIHLYFKYGFKEIPQEVKKYIASDIEMELKLK